MCVDYRALNSIALKNCCTIPRIDDLLDAVAGSAYFTSLDFTLGYHRILISKEDRPKTAFRTPFGHFQFKVLIEGLHDERPSHFSDGDKFDSSSVHQEVCCSVYR
jgi:hypothetical protein